jgi:hypothetical protein
MKRDTRRDAWNFDYLGIKAYLKKDERPEWERMSDDGMNKTLKFCIYCIFGYGAYIVALELWEKFV